MTDAEIIAELVRRPHSPARSKEIARALGASGPDDQVAIDAALDRLEADGRVVRLHGRHYAAPHPRHLVVGHLEMKRRRAGSRGRGDFGFLLPQSAREGDVYLNSRNLGDALHGDLVAVQILPRRGRQDLRGGRVIRVIHRANTRVVGVFETRDDPCAGFVVPDEERLNLTVAIPEGESRGARSGEKVIAELTEEPGSGGVCTGRIVQRLGEAGTWRAELGAVIERFALRTEFPEAVTREAADVSGGVATAGSSSLLSPRPKLSIPNRHVAELAPGLPGAIDESELARRVDWRDLLTITIDPADAKDHDDAISLSRRKGGGWKLWVHIADVSRFVPEDGAIDREARLRGTSAYLPGRVLPMLPERLSGDVCSLHAGVDRLAKTVVVEIDGEGEVVRSRIERSVIRSDHSLSYRGVREMHGDRGDGPVSGPDGPVSGPLLQLLTEAKELSQLLRRRRMEAGSLELDLPEVRLVLDDDDEILAIEPVEHDWTHQMIEEFMLLANRVVAEHTTDYGVPSLYRVHGEPSRAALKDFAEFAGSFGYIIKPPYGRRELQRVLDQCAGEPHAGAVQYMLLRSLKQAHYHESCLGHYALAFSRYCHFTSPIRRYPDLVTHRELDRLFPDRQPVLPTPRRRGGRSVPDETLGRLRRVAIHASRMERRAASAEREATRFRQIEFLRARGGEEHEGMITGVRPFGMFVELDTFRVSGMVAVEDLIDDDYDFDESSQCLRGWRRKRRYRMGDRVRVRVKNIDLVRRRVDLTLILDDPAPARGQDPPRPGRRGRRRGRRS